MEEAVTYQTLLQEVRDQGVQQGLTTVALNLLGEGMDVVQVAKLTGLPTEQVQQLKEIGADPLIYADPLTGFIGAVSHGSLAQQPDVDLYGD